MRNHIHAITFPRGKRDNGIVFSFFAAVSIAMALTFTPKAHAGSGPDTGWQGLYGGFTVGGVYGASRPDSEAELSPYFNSQFDLDDLRPSLQSAIDRTSFSGSGLFGYDFQDGALVYGIEADATVMNYSETSNASGSFVAAAVPVRFAIRTTIENNYSFSIRPKIGYVIGNWMVHAAAGPSVGHFKYDFSYDDDNSGGGPSDFTDSTIAFGVSSNLGVSYNLDNGWILRGDYVSSYYPEIINERQSFARSVGGTVFGASIKHEAAFDSHNLRIGLIKRF
ncbi:porin family protein [Hwanghaeella grinnelliae]|uniref:Porin family protein n=1 Tax=Hwanghaeella grinnelliae TaxID=2500179 RepID=A0A3S2VMS3_9PROT|nr:outer membrane beta-barrel protein [Hwanghaeella grinnelliae]RVU34030.1 porin family protein [Hwanghaeella grinnelliae]